MLFYIVTFRESFNGSPYSLSKKEYGCKWTQIKEITNFLMLFYITQFRESFNGNRSSVYKWIRNLTHI